MKKYSLAIRLIAILLILVHLYNVFAKEVVPRWSYGIFAIAMLLTVVLNLSKHVKSRQ